MKVLREAEAVGYLERLNESVSNLDDDPPFESLKSVLKIELAYFARLIKDDTKKGLAALAISSNGFPELGSLVNDIQTAYEDLDSIQSNLSQSLWPLLRG